MLCQALHAPRRLSMPRQGLPHPGVPSHKPSRAWQDLPRPAKPSRAWQDLPRPAKPSHVLSSATRPCQALPSRRHSVGRKLLKAALPRHACMHACACAGGRTPAVQPAQRGLLSLLVAPNRSARQAPPEHLLAMGRHLPGRIHTRHTLPRVAAVWPRGAAAPLLPHLHQPARLGLQHDALLGPPALLRSVLCNHGERCFVGGILCGALREDALIAFHVTHALWVAASPIPNTPYFQSSGYAPCSPVGMPFLSTRVLKSSQTKPANSS
eukprot:350136-Chlamydomonas_euryale.AAC.12